jgi:hypothetical protein
MTALVVIEGIVLVLMAILVAGLLRSHAEILRQLHALGAGESDLTELGTAPVYRRPGSGTNTPGAIAGPTPDGGALSVPLEAGTGLVLLAFLSSGCTTCKPFWRTFGGEFDLPRSDVRLVIVTKGAEEESPSKIAELAPGAVPTLMSTKAWDDMKIPVSPYFVMVDATTGAVVGEGAAASWAHVNDLLALALADAGMAEGATSGNTQSRARRVDIELSNAGIAPGDPSLYHNPHEHQ